MVERAFTAIGTKWQITVLDDVVKPNVFAAITAWLATFEARFSRFEADAEVNQFRHAPPSTYSISSEFAKLLQLAADIRTLTAGAFDPAISDVLEQAGYDASYSFMPGQHIDEMHLSQWTLRGNQLTISGPIAFDLGGIGKGYAIDCVTEMLRNAGLQYFIVDAGGDMYGTTKPDGRPWRVAIEYPGQPEEAAGVAELSNAGLAVSDVFRRRWRDWHHLIDAQTKTAIVDTVGAAAVAPTSLQADAMTSVVCFADPEVLKSAAEKFSASYLRITPQRHCQVSSDWPGELFLETADNFA